MTTRPAEPPGYAPQPQYAPAPAYAPPPAPAEPVSTVETTSAPVEYQSAPSIVFEGRPVFWINNRWIYREGGGRWVAYRNEPAELRRHREGGFRKDDRREEPRREEPRREERH